MQQVIAILPILAYATEAGVIWMIDTETQLPVRVLKGHMASVQSCSFSSDGTRVVQPLADDELFLPETDMTEKATFS